MLLKRRKRRMRIEQLCPNQLCTCYISAYANSISLSGPASNQAVCGLL